MQQDAANNPHSILQAEGGEQGDPLMPALFALGVAPALRAMQTDLLPSESVRAFLDDTYLTSQRCRTAFLLQRLEHHLFSHAHIRLNHRHQTPSLNMCTSGSATPTCPLTSKA